MKWILDLLTHLCTPSENTRDYSATVNLPTLQITTATAKHFPACSLLTSRSLLTVSNNGDSSTHCCETLLSQPPVQNPSQFPQSQLPTILNWIIEPYFLSLRHRAQLNCQPSNIFQLSSQLSWGPRYIASGRTQQETPLSTIPLFF
jgi:hypothetical protein